jgi:hypothetical protein
MLGLHRLAFPARLPERGDLGMTSKESFDVNCLAGFVARLPAFRAE